MEQPFEPQDQGEENRVWEVGDLYRFPTGLVLCIDANDTFACFITAEGTPLADIQLLPFQKDVYFLHNTGLTYRYQNRKQVEEDYINGLFTPYFEIL